MSPETKVLLRQVHPNFIPNGDLTSQAFIPFSKDESKLSVYDGDKITPEESYHHYISIEKLESDSVWGVTAGEVAAVGLGMLGNPTPVSPAHALIDFSKHELKIHRKLAKQLKQHAQERGCLFKPAV